MSVRGSSKQNLKSRTPLYAAMGVLWIVCTALAIHQAMIIESTPGPNMGVPGAAPAHIGWRFVMIVHPKCPCSGASLQALSAATSKIRPPISVRVIFAGDRPESPTPNMQLASAIEGAEVKWLSPSEAQKTYGALTSGTLIAYRPDGRVAFKGGITPGRGVKEPSFAVDIIGKLLSGTSVETSQPVFGCALSAEAIAPK